MKEKKIKIHRVEQECLSDIPHFLTTHDNTWLSQNIPCSIGRKNDHELNKDNLHLCTTSLEQQDVRHDLLQSFTIQDKPMNRLNASDSLFLFSISDISGVIPVYNQKETIMENKHLRKSSHVQTET